MRIQMLSINHNSTTHSDLMLRSLFAHHAERPDLVITVLDNNSPDIEDLRWVEQFGATIVQSGYRPGGPINTHGEILAKAMRDHASCDAFLIVDPDVCFLADDSIPAMAEELSAEPRLFAVQATPRPMAGDAAGWGPDRQALQVRAALRYGANVHWEAETGFEVTEGSRVSPFCTLIRNDETFRAVVEHVGLSVACVIRAEDGRWWNTFGLMTEVMATHGRTWRLSSVEVVHLGGGSRDLTDEQLAFRRTLVSRYGREAGRPHG